MDANSLRPDALPDSLRIKRKPVSNPNLRASAHADAPFLCHAPTSPAVVPPLLQPPSYTDLYGPPPPGSAGPRLPPRPRTAGASSSAPVSPISPVPPSPAPSPVQKAYGEARHFLGGLITHPTESNKHVTILRHSHGLVFYRGNATSVAVSIFADAPLPPDRTLWLQSKGWSGKTGMRTKAFFRLHDSWLDVTPSMPLRADQVEPDDERAWQRDIKKFWKKAPARPREKHQLRETAVIRVPADAGDGYFQLVLCQGLKKKVLGNSPVFRVLSTSTNPSSLRGASLSTLPLEVGAMVASVYAQTAARTVFTPAAAALKTKTNKHRPAWLKQTALQKAYSASGIEERVSGIVNGAPGPNRRMPGAGLTPVATYEPSPIEEGPRSPFPMTFKARGEATPPSSYSPENTVTLTLSRIPDWVLNQLWGYFFGWVRIETSTETASSGTWCPTILSVRTLDPLQASRVKVSQIAKRVVTLRVLEEVPLPVHKLEIRIMGFLREDIPPPMGSNSRELADAQAAAVEANLLADAYDVSVVQSTLAHPAWAADTMDPTGTQQPGTGWVDRTLDGYTSIRARGQKWVEQVPLHRLGVRSAVDELRERQVVASGFYIVR
ncbi:hypothetical protein N7492_004160 [Penicillium capsulatum]|uniref:LipA and NB-ARC domain protein n=1 Tax=Penicillium capsulatum TaxID=69766 RepID=A0A9W9ILX7_9EURO|nr:hypothetical protein N7492_004160 [Penicillium capsulatum]